MEFGKKAKKEPPSTSPVSCVRDALNRMIPHLTKKEFLLLRLSFQAEERAHIHTEHRDGYFYTSTTYKGPPSPVRSREGGGGEET